jgi:segregation and condensation protein A
MAASPVAELDLDLDAFEGPFDLLLSLVLRDELPLREVDLAEVVIAFLAGLEARDRLDLDACGEFLVLISALLELKARGLFPDEDGELSELEPEEAAEELARRLAEYRRAKDGAAWLAERLADSRERFFRLGPAPLTPVPPEPVLATQSSARLADALRALAVEPPAPSTTHMALAFPPVSQFVERWRSLLRRRGRLDFDQEVTGFSRVEVAVAFLALLELVKQRELAVAQASPFAPIRISRADPEERRQERSATWTAHSA